MTEAYRQITLAASEAHAISWNFFGGSRNFSKQTVNTTQRLKFMYIRVRLDIVKSANKLLRKKRKTKKICIRFVLFSRWPLR